jgi:hypothetical protein
LLLLACFAADQPPLAADDFRAADRIDKAVEFQEQASRHLAGGNKEAATADQAKALAELARARELLALRLWALQLQHYGTVIDDARSRCAAIVQKQQEILDEARTIDAALAKRPGRQRTRDESLRAARLSDRQAVLAEAVGKLLRPLEDENLLQSYQELFRQVREDMSAVRQRLARTDTGTHTQEIAQSVVDILREIVGTFQGEGAVMHVIICDNPDIEGMVPYWGPEQRRQALIGRLKLVRRLQVEIGNRTEQISKRLAAKAADETELKGALKQLAEREGRVRDALNRASATLEQAP